MELVASRGALEAALACAARALSARALTVQESTVWLDAHDNLLEVAADGPDHSVRRSIDAEVHSPGQGWFPAKLLHEIASRLPGDQVQLCDAGTNSGSAMHLTAQSCRFRVPQLRVSDQPAAAYVAGEQIGTVALSELSQAVSAIHPAAARAGHGLVALTGICLAPSAEHLTLVATDRYRLALRRTPWTPTSAAVQAADDGKPEAYVIPAATLVDAMRDLAGESAIALQLGAAAQGRGGPHGPGFVSLVGERSAVHARLLADPFPDWNGLLPAEPAAKTQVTVPAAMLEDTLRRLAVVGDVFTMDVHPAGSLLLSVSDGRGEGDARESLVADVAGEAMIASYNLTYIRETIAAIGSDTVCLSSPGPKRPLIITDPNGASPRSTAASAVGLVMPVIRQH